MFFIKSKTEFPPVFPFLERSVPYCCFFSQGTCFRTKFVLK